MLIEYKTMERITLENMLAKNKAKRRKLEHKIKALKKEGRQLFEKLVNEHYLVDED